MPELLKVEFQDNQGNKYYFHTDSSVVFREDGTTIENALVDLQKNKFDKANLLSSLSEVNATTLPGFTPDALAVKELTANLNSIKNQNYLVLPVIADLNTAMEPDVLHLHQYTPDISVNRPTNTHYGTVMTRYIGSANFATQTCYDLYGLTHSRIKMNGTWIEWTAK